MINTNGKASAASRSNDGMSMITPATGRLLDPTTIVSIRAPPGSGTQNQINRSQSDPDTRTQTIASQKDVDLKSRTAGLHQDINMKSRTTGSQKDIDMRSRTTGTQQDIEMRSGTTGSIMDVDTEDHSGRSATGSGVNDANYANGEVGRSDMVPPPVPSAGFDPGHQLWNDEVIFEESHRQQDPGETSHIVSGM